MTQARSEYGLSRGYARLVRLVLVLLWSGAKMLAQRPRTLRERSLWRQRMCWSIEHAMGLQIHVVGCVPTSGMVVSNHLSYLDAVVLGGLIPGVFVAKAEVREWPLAGWLTARGGTIYLKRENVRAAAEVNRGLVAAMADGLPVVVFPEGTTTGATEPLPFHPALFDPALRRGESVWPVALVYSVNGSSERVVDDVCYWGMMRFMPHLVRMMRLPNIRAVVRVADVPVFATTRAEAAAMSRAVVAQMLSDGRKRPLRVAAARGVDGHEAATVEALQH